MVSLKVIYLAAGLLGLVIAAAGGNADVSVSEQGGAIYGGLVMTVAGIAGVLLPLEGEGRILISTVKMRLGC